MVPLQKIVRLAGHSSVCLHSFIVHIPFRVQQRQIHRLGMSARTGIRRGLQSQPMGDRVHAIQNPARLGSVLLTPIRLGSVRIGSYSGLVRLSLAHTRIDSQTKGVRRCGKPFEIPPTKSTTFKTVLYNNKRKTNQTIPSNITYLRPVLSCTHSPRVQLYYHK